MSPWDRKADVLREKAEGDEHALQLLARHADVEDAIIGFHAQQAIEKLIKAVLSRRRVPFPKIHDLLRLIEMLQHNDIDVTPELEGSVWLTPYAATMRYDNDDPDPYDLPPLNRPAVIALVAAVREWATPHLGEPPPSPPEEGSR